MSPHQIIAVAVRLFAIWMAVGIFLDAPSIYSQSIDPNFSAAANFLITSFIVLLMLGLAYLLWRFPLTIASKLLEPSVHESAESGSPDLWLAMGCSLVGLWLLSMHVPSLAQTLELWWKAPDYEVSLVYNLTGTAIALWLMLGARTFRKLFWWARYAGRSSTNDNS